MGLCGTSNLTGNCSLKVVNKNFGDKKFAFEEFSISFFVPCRPIYSLVCVICSQGSRIWEYQGWPSKRLFRGSQHGRIGARRTSYQNFLSKKSLKMKRASGNPLMKTIFRFLPNFSQLFGVGKFLVWGEDSGGWWRVPPVLRVKIWSALSPRWHYLKKSKHW